MALNILGDPVDGSDIETSVSNIHLFMELFSSYPPGGDGLLSNRIRSEQSLFVCQSAKSCLTENLLMLDTFYILHTETTLTCAILSVVVFT